MERKKKLKMATAFKLR